MKMVRYGLRAHRWALLALVLLGFLGPYLVGAEFQTAVGASPAARAAFARGIDALASQLVYIYPHPLHAETVAGWVWWRGLSYMPLFVGAWALAAATGLIRNEEQRGLLEMWLASTLGRFGLVLARSAAFTIAAVGVMVAAALGALAGAATAGGSFGLQAVVEQLAAYLGLTLVCFAVGLLAAQLATTWRSAAVLGGVVLLALYFVDVLTRVRTDLGGWVNVSPFYLADATNVMAPGGRFAGTATIALYVIAVVVAALAALAFRRRDLLASLFGGGRAPERAVYTPSSNPLLRVPVLDVLYEQRLGLLAWLVGGVATAGLVLSIVSSMSSLFKSEPTFQAYLRTAGTDQITLAFVSAIWFYLAGLLAAIYAITQIARWASDDSSGRLEMEIAQPLPRWRVVVQRGLTLAIGATLLAAVGSLTIAAGAPGQGIHLDGGRMLLATALLALLGLSFGGIGALVIARLPRVAVPLLAVVAVLGFYLTELGPLFKLPDWTLNLSLFHLTGTPLTTGVYWTGLWIMVAVTVVGFGGALLAMRFREVGR